jgi:hypothetical protein
MAELHLFRGPDLGYRGDGQAGPEYVSAASPEEAWAVYERLTGFTLEGARAEGWEPGWQVVPDDAPLEVEDEERQKATKTAGEWAREMPRTVVCSEEF